MNVINELLARNQAYAASFDQGGLTAPPTGKVAIVACMDARLNVFAALGLRPGEAHVLRNAGGVVTDDVIRSLAISQRRLGTEEVMLVHHTDCGMLSFTDDEFRQALERDAGAAPSWSAGTFSDLEAAVRESIARVKASPFLPHTGAVRGFVYEVETGRLREVG
jgi:carbonic anhydrase